MGIVHRPIDILAREGLDPAVPIAWLPEGRSFTFDADPFGWWREGRLHVFVERYDYRTRKGVIDCVVLDEAFRPVARRPVLEEPWHLSYPAIFEADGELWMLPEAWRSGALTLYRCRDFPFAWERAFVLKVGPGAVDATPFRHDGLWWLFFSSGPDRRSRMGSLHVRWAERLEGPWTAVPPEPVHVDLAGARPGGRPFLIDGLPVLPAQDCTRTYGGAIRLLHLERLRQDGVAITPGRRIAPPARWAPFDEGLHTLNGCGPVTLIDAKRVDRSGRGWLLDLARAIRRRGAPSPS